MGKVTTYILTMTGIMLLLYYTGFIQSTTSIKLLELALSPGTLSLTTLFSTTIDVFTLLSAAGLAIGFALGGKPDLAIMAPATIYLFDMGRGFLQAFSVVSATSPIIATLLFGPVMVLFVFTCIEWWRGITT
jgi:hypothetical protein